MITTTLLALAALAMPAPPAPHVVSYPVMAYMDVPLPDGTSRQVYGWQDLAGFHSRPVDQPLHDIPLGTPLDVLRYGKCFREDCKPAPPGAMPGDPPAPPAPVEFRGPPE